METLTQRRLVSNNYIAINEPKDNFKKQKITVHPQQLILSPTQKSKNKREPLVLQKTKIKWL